MSTPVHNDEQIVYPVVLRRNQPENRAGNEITAEQLGRVVMPILETHHALLYRDYYEIGDLRNATLQLRQRTRDLLDHLNAVTDHLNAVTDGTTALFNQVNLLTAQSNAQAAEIQRLRNMPFNRLQETLSNWCAYL